MGRIATPLATRPAELRIGERLVALILAGVISWSYPVLFLFGKDVLVLGIPLSYLYLYISWALFVGLVALIMEWPSAGNPKGTPEAQKTVD